MNLGKADLKRNWTQFSKRELEREGKGRAGIDYAGKMVNYV